MRGVFLCFIASLLCVPISVIAQETNNVLVQNIDGTTQSALLVTIQKIIFDVDVLVLNTSEGEFRLPLENIDKITFGESTATIVEDVQNNTTRFLQSGNQLTIESDYAIKHLYVVNMSGQVIINKTLASVNEANITLPNSGVFVVFVETTQGYLARKVINH